MVWADELLSFIQTGIQFIGVTVITFGAVNSVYYAIVGIFAKTFDPNYIRLQFGNSVILGLEFMVGADIIGSLIRPDYYTLGMLAIVVIIRTILSYFLTRELEGLTPQQRKTLS